MEVALEIIDFVAAADERLRRRGSPPGLVAIGDVDLIATPAGSGGYDALVSTADTLELDDLEVPVASIADLIAMKEAAGRPKDLVEVEILKALEREGRRLRLE